MNITEEFRKKFNEGIHEVTHPVLKDRLGSKFDPSERIIMYEINILDAFLLLVSTIQNEEMCGILGKGTHFYTDTDMSALFVMTTPNGYYSEALRMRPDGLRMLIETEMREEDDFDEYRWCENNLDLEKEFSRYDCHYDTPKTYQEAKEHFNGTVVIVVKEILTGMSQYEFCFPFGLKSKYRY